MSVRPLAVLVAATALLTACRDDGRTLAPAPTVPLAPATTAPTTTSATDTLAGASLSVDVPGLGQGGALDPTFTCDGIDIHPEVVLTGAPAGTVELALSLVDLDADGYVHWVVSGLSGTITRLEGGVLPPTAVAATTTGGVRGWEGPCPPAGDGPHRYLLSAYAMFEPVGLAPGLAGDEALAILQDAAVEVGTRTLSYER